MSDGGRLIIEAIVVTVAISAISAAAFYAYVTRRPKRSEVSELIASNNELSRRVRSLEQDRERDHLALLRMQTRLELHNSYSRALADYSRMLAEKLRELGQLDIPPAPMPPPELTEPTPAGLSSTAIVNEKTLVNSISELFDIDEIDDLAFRVGIDGDELEGRVKSTRARSLVQHVKRRGMLPELIQIARLLRPEGDI